MRLSDGSSSLLRRRLKNGQFPIVRDAEAGNPKATTEVTARVLLEACWSVASGRVASTLRGEVGGAIEIVGKGEGESERVTKSAKSRKAGSRV